jgi:sentrin-specific protease 1
MDIVTTTVTKSITRNNQSNKYDQSTKNLINLENEFYIPNSSTIDSNLSNLLDSEFIINEHIINIINKEVVIASLQNQNIDYIQNVVICYIIKQFDIESANTKGLISHLENIIKELILILNKGIDQYFNLLTDQKPKKSKKNKGICDDKNDTMNKLIKNYENNINTISSIELPNINEYQISNITLSLVDTDNQSSLINTNINTNKDKNDLKNDIKRRIITIMLYVIKFVSESFDCFRTTDAYIKSNVNPDDLSKSFVSFMNSDNFIIYINNIKFTKGINKSAMIAFYKKIFNQELVVNAKSIYDCVQIHQLYIKKNKNNRKKSINEISDIISKKMDVNPKLIENLIDKFNEIPDSSSTCSALQQNKPSKKRSIHKVDDIVKEADEEASFISDTDDYKNSLIVSSGGKSKRQRSIEDENEDEDEDEDNIMDVKTGKIMDHFFLQINIIFYIDKAKIVENAIMNSIKDIVFVSLDSQQEIDAAKQAISKVKTFIKSTEQTIENNLSSFLNINEPIHISDDDDDDNQPTVDDSNSLRYDGNEVFSNQYTSRFNILKDIDTVHLSNKLLFNEKTNESSNTAITRSGINFSYQMIQTLKPNVWINTNIIDYMGTLLYYRHLRMKNNQPEIVILHNYFFQEIFFKQNDYKFKKSKFKSIKAIGNLKLLFIPVYHNSHFFLMTYDFTTKTIKYYDSLYNKDRGGNFSSILLKYVIDLYKYYNLNVSEKDINIVIEKDGIPQQDNSYDCGIYTIMFIDFLIDNINFNEFNLDHQWTLRHTILYSIVKDKLAY